MIVHYRLVRMKSLHRHSLTVEVKHSSQRAFPKDEVLLNILIILITLDKSHLEMSVLNDGAHKNIPHMSVTLDTPHFERSPLYSFDPVSNAIDK